MSIRQNFCLFTCLVAIAACTVLSAANAQAPLPKYDAIYVFGDSYCDVGNLFAVTGVPAAPYYHGHFSNGPIWVEHVAGALGLPMLPYLAGGTDYAFGGALVTKAVPLSPAFSIPSVPQQVELYLSQHQGKADPNALYILEGGGNDILDATGGSADALALQIALGTAGEELLLRRAGARHFLIPNLFDVGMLPAAVATNPTFATAASIATDKYLNDLLQFEDAFEGVHVQRLNVFTLFKAVDADATHFGFTNITTPCFNATAATICADPDHTLYWDTVHPTVFGHSFFAVTTINALDH